MAHVDILVLQGHLDLCRQFQQTHVVRHRGTALAHAFRDLLLRHTCSLCQMLIGQRDLNGVQILTLDVLHECHLHRIIFLHRTDIGGDRGQTCHL